MQLQQVLDAQLSAIADQISDFDNVVIAYEPVWAIGTGQVWNAQHDQDHRDPCNISAEKGVCDQCLSVCMGATGTCIDQLVVLSRDPRAVQVASPDQAEEVHLYVREWFEQRIGRQDAQALRIIYGKRGSHSLMLQLAADVRSRKLKSRQGRP